MNIAIRYYTRSGNTKKLADAISETLNIEANDVSVSLSENTDILFLGCSYYAFDVDEAVKDFIMNNKENIGKIICFGTSAMMKSVKKPVSKIAKTVGITVSDEEFHCRGRFGKIHKHRPDAHDLKDIAEFAKKVTQQK